MAQGEGRMKDSEELNRLKISLEKYRELMLPLNKVFEWEKPVYPVALVSIITVIFSIVWYFEPSVLSTLCILGIFSSVADFMLPKLLSAVFATGDWTVVQERQYDAICMRLLNFKQHLANTRKWLSELKTSNPRMYLLLMMGVFAVLAWLGSLIDNLLLTYLLVMSMSLVPGLRKRGVFQLLRQKIEQLRGTKAKTN